jgi:hypothetical protein
MKLYNFDPPIVTPPFSEWPGEGFFQGTNKVWRMDANLANSDNFACG